MTLYELRGRLEDGISWEQIGYPCPELSTCKTDAERFTDAVVEVRAQGSNRVVYRAVRRPVN